MSNYTPYFEALINGTYLPEQLNDKKITEKKEETNVR